MFFTRRTIASMSLLVCTVLLLVGCGIPLIHSNTTTPNTILPTKQAQPNPKPKPAEPQQIDPKVWTDPNSLLVLVNKQHALPAGYKPNLVDDFNVPFTFAGKDEKRLMRPELAKALEIMFAAAKKDGIYLAGVSAYRSEALQKSLFDSYVQEQGYKMASVYSALPGHSEHETGLAIDVSGSTGKCAADNCFADTPEAKWLAQHVGDYGFIIRYLKGKEAITGYDYEPWHIRYVGEPAAKIIMSKGITLEEYLGQVPSTTGSSSGNAGASGEPAGTPSGTPSGTSPNGTPSNNTGGQ